MSKDKPSSSIEALKELNQESSLSRELLKELTYMRVENARLGDRNADLVETLKEIANNGVEFETPDGHYVVDSNPIEVAQKALKQNQGDERN